MLYVNQEEYPHVLYKTHTAEPESVIGPRTTFKGSGCGLASAMMVVDRLLPNVEFSMWDAIELSYKTGANYSSGTDYPIYAPAVAEKFDLKLEISNDIERLKYCLQTGGVAVCHCQDKLPDYRAVFTSGGHYITVISIQEDGRAVVMDPAYTEGRYDIPSRAGKVEMKYGTLAVCELQTLIMDTKPVDPNCFYLFWRK